MEESSSGLRDRREQPGGGRTRYGTGAVGECEPRSKARAGGRRSRREEGEKRGRKCCDGPEDALSDVPSGRARPRHGEGAGRGAFGAGPAAWDAEWAGGVELEGLAELVCALPLRLRSVNSQWGGWESPSFAFRTRWSFRSGSVPLLPSQGHRAVTALGWALGTERRSLSCVRHLLGQDSFSCGAVPKRSSRREWQRPFS